ncbi:lipase member H-like [Lycorma delicatula]|uniref:lipase member H-like n=1 Tax=Lycorma delicatula TaxID=130591 RepID=UPI003F51733D
MGSPHAQSTQLIIQGYVERGGSNVLGVDWKTLARGPWYGNAADEAQTAAKLLAEWMNKVVSNNYTSWDKIHVVGFSLGAQVAGLTSKYLPQGSRVGRLTGLDPARPMFDDKLPEDRLDAEDSDFTTVLHTCGGFLAFTDPIGHVDFFPNGGENPQPPCKDKILNGILHKPKNGSARSFLLRTDHGPTKVFAGLVCSHYIALALWVESLRPNTTMIARHCSTWKNYLNNDCDKSVSGDYEVIMGENTPRSTRGTFFIETPEEVSYAPQLKELIETGIHEYSKLFTADTSDDDHGHGEVQEIIPTTMPDITHSSTIKQTHEEKDNFEINNKLSENSALRSSCSYTLILLIMVVFLPRLK